MCPLKIPNQSCFEWNFFKGVVSTEAPLGKLTGISSVPSYFDNTVPHTQVVQTNTRGKRLKIPTQLFTKS